MRIRLTQAVTLPALLLLSLLSPSLSSTTLSITSTTVCGILAGNSPQSIRCSNFSSSFPIFPNVSFRSLSGGPSFFCALRSDTLTFFCYSPLTLSPKRVHTGPVTLSDLSVGPTQIAALTNNATSVQFWRGDSAFPNAPVNGASTFRSLTSGNGFTCAVSTVNGTVSCWGRNRDAIQRAFENETMLTVVAGDSHACGVNTAGFVVCKGSNSSGQLDAPVGPAFGYAGLALGGNHTCAIETTNNTVLCWGGGGGNRWLITTS